MDAESFLSFVEETIRKLLPTAESVRFRPANNLFDLSFTDSDDFVTAAMCANSANIHCQVVTTFEDKLKVPRPIRACVLRLSLDSACLDSRLIIFLYELLNLACYPDGDFDDIEKLRNKAQEYDIAIGNRSGNPEDSVL